MSAQPGNTMSDAWANLEGHVVNGVFPLLRYLGSSSHSGVFLTRSANHEPPDVALKLVPVGATLQDIQLSRWQAAVDLAHPHLIRIFEAGRCQVGGLHYLYAVMEYADQNLAQLLEHRALADDEAREMLVPTLSALAYLHGRKLMQGRLKPSNVLVVGDQLKLASDTVGAAVDGGESATNDVWALGVTMCEALARRQPSGLDSEAGAVVLPPGLSPAFRELIAWCLSRKPQDRPEVSELQAWLRGEHTARSAGATQQPGAIGPPGSATRDPVVVQSTAPIVAAPKAVVSNRQPAKSHVVPLIIGAVVALALIWVGFRVLRSDRVAVPSQAPTPARAQGEAAPEVIDAPRAEAVAPASATARASGKSTVPPSAVHTEIPDVPRRAQQTIRGTIRVSVRVIVDKDGKVFAALVDRPGPSRYFERLAINAAKKWTFVPADTAGQRLLQVRFNFTRAGATAQAAALR